MQIESGEPHRWRSSTVIAVFAAAAALAGGAQAIAPTTAGAMVNQGNECAHLEGLDLFFCELEHMGVGGGGGGSSASTGSGGASSEPGEGVSRIPRTEEQRNEEYVQSDDVGLPTWISDRDSFWATVQRRWRREACTRIRRHIKQRIHKLYGEEFDFDQVRGSGDDTLNELEDQWANRGC